MFFLDVFVCVVVYDKAVTLYLFNLFINQFIVQLKANGIGCTIIDSYVGAIMYADDIILLSASVKGLQCMLNVCKSIAWNFNLQEKKVNRHHHHFRLQRPLFLATLGLDGFPE